MHESIHAPFLEERRNMAKINIGLSNWSTCNSKKVAFFIGPTAILFLAIWLFLTYDIFPGHAGLNSWLLERLVSTKPMPEDFNTVRPNSKRIIYVLGGSQNSLTHRFKTAARIYQERGAQKIFILRRPGITEYDPLLGRNLTNDEWSVKRLEDLGVQKEHVELLSLNYGFFGTLTEARGVSQEVVNRGYDVLIIVSSPYHTARVRGSFSKYLKDKAVNVFVYRSDDYPQLRELLLEYLKLKIYENILL